MENNINTLLHECDRLKERLTEIRPLPVEALKKIEEAFAIEYTYESNRIWKLSTMLKRSTTSRILQKAKSR